MYTFVAKDPGHEPSLDTLRLLLFLKKEKCLRVDKTSLALWCLLPRNFDLRVSHGSRVLPGENAGLQKLRERLQHLAHSVLQTATTLDAAA